MRTALSMMGAIILMAAVTATAAEKASNATCLACHGSENIRSAGTGAHVYINPTAFSGTTHAVIGCTSCHDTVSPQHPKDGSRPARATCNECHGQIQQEYAKSLHAGKASCPDCHDPHAARRTVAVSGRDINAQCARCHEAAKTIASHAKWLPQASLHLDSVPCVTCHTGSKDYFITLYIESSNGSDKHGNFQIASYRELKTLSPSGNPVSLIDTDGDGHISLAELRHFNLWAHGRGLRLLGMMMPEKVTHSFQILDNRWNCTFCHASGPAAMQTSHLAIPGENGLYTRMNVEKGAILDILYGTPDFYMLGSTRSALLDKLGAAIIVCGMLFPLTHGTMRFLTRKNRKEGHS